MTITIKEQSVKVSMLVKPSHLERFLKQAKKAGLKVTEIQTGDKQCQN